MEYSTRQDRSTVDVEPPYQYREDQGAMVVARLVRGIIVSRQQQRKKAAVQFRKTLYVV